LKIEAPQSDFHISSNK